MYPRDKAKNYAGVCKRRKRNSAFILNYLKMHPCVDCSEPDPIVLEFDHVVEKKKFDVKAMITLCCSIKTIVTEIEKCEIRCANCHRKKTARMNARHWSHENGGPDGDRTHHTLLAKEHRL